jgi:glutathione synthase/RimK-type ligase-like ATP-grasp enzyme
VSWGVSATGQRRLGRVNSPDSGPATRSGGTVLLLTGSGDTAAEAVEEELRRRRRPVARFDPASFPLEAKLTAWSGSQSWSGHISGSGIELPLDDIGSVWFHRPAQFGFHPDMSPAERRFADLEAQMAVGGLLRSLDCLWVNHPDKAAAARYEPLQLALGARAGFQIPRSLITNDPKAVLSFFGECEGQVIYKPLSSGDLTASAGAGPLSVYTSVVDEDQLRLGDAIGATPCLFQEQIPKKTELRLTIIGNEVFPVQIDSQHAAQSAVDRRRGYEHLRYRVCQLPRDIRQNCLELAGQLGLAFATVDFAITPANEYVFMGINPGGKWLWLEKATGLPMVEAMADLLSGAAGSNGP